MAKPLKVFFASSDSGGCGHYRSHLPAKYLNNILFKTDYHDGFPTLSESMIQSDIVIIQRHCDAYFLEWIPKAQRSGQKVLYDIDDSVWHLPHHNPVFKAYRDGSYGKRENVEKIISLCDGVVVSTDPLAEIIRKKFGKPILVAPNLVEIPTVKYYPSNTLRIGFAGSETHAGDFNPKIYAALNKIKRKFPAVEILFMGLNPKEIAHIPVPACLPGLYLEQLRLLDLDIAIAPLQANHFNECKSNLKFLEYSIVGATTVASASYPYRETIVDGETGFLVEDKADWYSTLYKLCSNKELREQVALKAWELVSQEYTWLFQAPILAKKYLDFFESLETK